jgi:FMN phosphatase YigB (HAD superfamily)
VFSYEVKLAKPNPMIYDLACERIGVSPTECIFVGDGGSKELDLDDATKAGMIAYHATWFIPNFISERIMDYSKLTKPSDLLDPIRVK